MRTEASQFAIIFLLLEMTCEAVISVDLTCKDDDIVGIICDFKNLPISTNLQPQIKSVEPNYKNKVFFVEIALRDHSRYLPMNIGVHFKFIENLVIQHSSLEILMRNDFSNMLQLEVISFIYNEIHSIPNDVFNDLPNLRHVDLANNKIKHIPQELFKASSKLMIFYVPNNQIEKVSSSLFENSVNISKIDFENNPINLFSFDRDQNFSNFTNIKYFNLISKNKWCNFLYEREVNLKDNRFSDMNESEKDEFAEFVYDICESCNSNHDCNLSEIF